MIFHRTPEPSTFPGPPSKPMVTDITETEMSLTWKANANHGASPIVSYTVEYFSHETGEVSILKNIFKNLKMLEFLTGMVKKFLQRTMLISPDISYKWFL